jgi:excisionase family DNA binding protein
MTEPMKAILGTRPDVGAALLQPSVLDAITQALAGALAAMAVATGQATAADDSQLLNIDQAAELLQVSRMTVIRLVDEGQLPAIVIRRGKVQKIRRIPRAYIQALIADATAGRHIELNAATITQRRENAPA